MFLYFGKAIPPFTSQPVGARLARLQGAKVYKCMKNRNPYLCGNKGKKPHPNPYPSLRGKGSDKPLGLTCRQHVNRPTGYPINV